MRRFPPRRILVAADLSAPSLAALNAAKAMARRWGAALEIVHVESPPMFDAWAGPGLPPGMPPATREPRHKIEEKLRGAAAGFPAERLKYRTVHGWPPAALLEMARPERADLMVMGTHGYAGLDRALTGSVSEAVIRRARIPVLAVPESGVAAAATRVLAPWNGRPYATRALRWARELARGIGATLVVLHVAEHPWPFDPNLPELRRRLETLLGAATDWTLRNRSGDARARIVAEANSGFYDYVVLSAHRRRFGADFVLGSTLERVLRHASVAVLAVPSGAVHRRPLRRLAARAAARLF